MLHLPVWNKSRKSTDNYQFELTETGWRASFIPGLGDPCECQPDGSPFLQANARQDSIHYPDDFGHHLEYLWRQAKENNMDEQSIQQQLDLLGEWQEAMEKNRPMGIWNGVM